jgi:hypothetical protein
MADDLGRAHAVLLARARAEGEDELIERLRIEPPRPRPHGYGILPEILDDGPLESVATRRNTYSLESMSTAYAHDFRDAAILAGRAVAEPELPLEPWVDEFQRLHKQMRNLEDHLDYHARWQVEIVAHQAWFQSHNRISAQVSRMVELESQEVAPEQVTALRDEILGRLAPFRPTPGLCLAERADGMRVLTVEVATDIEDDAFLDRVRRAVERTWSASEAAHGRRFALELRWRRIPPGQLYPAGAPVYGAAIDAADHQRRFPDEALVFTTGVESTHAWTGRSVLLGPSPTSGRTLAHEFGHLLGFDDAYLRGYEGDPAGTYGAVIVEWVGLRDDLMGNPLGGAVTAEMIDRLIAAYGDACDSE